MTTFIVFVISLVLIIFLFIMKSWEIYYGRKIFLEDLFLKSDALILKILLKIKYRWSHVNFKNIGRVFSWLVIKIKELTIAVKRRFDHKQSPFFIQRKCDFSKNKSTTSFFLKDVADYKKNLPDGRIEK